MAKDAIIDYDGSTPGNNTDIAGINIDEGWAPSSVNNALRELMSQIKDAHQSLITTGGSANAYTLTMNQPPTAYATGQMHRCKIHAANTGGSTINVSGLGAKTIKAFVSGSSAALTGGEMPINYPAMLVYDGTDFLLLNPVPPMELISQQTASNDASLDFESLFSTVHQNYELRISNLVPATDAVDLYMRLADSGTTWLTSPYAWSRHATASNAVSGVTANNSDARFQIADVGVGSDTAETGVSGKICLFNPIAAAYTSITWDVAVGGADTFTYNIRGSGALRSSLTHESVQLLFDTGNCESGDVQLWGYR